MKESERDALVILLAAASGSADGWSYFGMGHAFVANMTGNTVLLGVSIFHLHGDLIHPLLALAGYVAGTALGTLIARNVQPGSVWDKRVSWALFLEALLLLAAEVVWVATRQQLAPHSALALLVVLAIAVGMQSAAMMQLRIPGVATTYITGTWTTLTNGLMLLFARQPHIERHKAQFEERFLLQAAVLAVYFLSAVFTGWSFRHAPALVGGMAATAVLLAAGYGALRNQRD